MKTSIPRQIRWAALFIIISSIISIPAYSHAVLVSSSPRNNAVLKSPPKQVLLKFNSKIEKRVTELTLRNSANRKIALPTSPNKSARGPADTLIIPMPKLKLGSYRLEYRVLATDGHITPGLIRFKITGKKNS